MDDAPKEKSLLAALRGAIDRHVKQRPRDLIVRNAIEDPAEVLAQRVMEGDACEFCSQFANSGPVDPRKVSEKFHAYCKCHFMLFFQETKHRERFASDEELRKIGVTMEEGADPDYYEKRDAMVLAALGRKVEFLKRHLSGPRRADTLIDGELVEFKNPTSSGLFTVQNQILKNLYGSNKEVMRPQSDVLLISNVRNSMTMLDMERSLAAAFDERSTLTAAEKAYIRKIILLDERTRRVRVYEMKDAGVARLNGPRRRQVDTSTNARKNQGLKATTGGGGNKPPNNAVEIITGGSFDDELLRSAIIKRNQGVKLSEDEARSFIRSNYQSKRIIEGKQAAHVDRSGTETTNSVFSENVDLEALVDEYAGTGTIHINYDPITGMNQIRETIQTNGIIGKWRFVVNDEIVDESETDRFTIHYSNNGIHLVPSMPSWRL